MHKQEVRQSGEPASRRKWTRLKEPEARAIVAEWKESGLNAEAFSRKRGVSSARLWYWSKRLAASAGQGEVKFVAVALPTQSAQACNSQIEIEHAGVRVRVREDMEVERIARLVFAIASVRC